MVAMVNKAPVIIIQSPRLMDSQEVMYRTFNETVKVNGSTS